MAGLSAEMIVDGRVPSDPQVAPDGRHVAFVVALLGRREEEAQSAIWLARTDGSTAPRQVTAGLVEDRMPRWSPDGAWLYFLSDRAERSKAQLHRLPLAGGEAEPLTDWKPGIAGIVPLPDGRTVAVLAPDPPTEQEERRERERDDAQVFGERWPLVRLRLLDLGSRELRLLDGHGLADRHVAGVAPFAGVAPSPDGAQLAVATWPTPELDNWTGPSEISLIGIASGEVRLVCQLPAGVVALTWDRGGRRLIALSYAAGGGVSGTALFTIDTAEGGSRLLTADLAACPTGLCRGGDADPLITVAAGLDTTIEHLDSGSDELRRVSHHLGDLSSPSASADGQVVAALRSTANEPTEVWVGPPAGPFRRLTNLRPELREIEWGRQERLAWTSADGLAIDGLLILPPGKGRVDGPFPLITIVHGGPYGRFADSFQLSWAPSGQWLATAGYAVLLPNPRGGMGHGQRFAACVAGAVGIDDWGDIVAGIDTLIAQGVADPNRLGIGGWSQGGFMTAWAVGQTNRFRAGVMGAGVSDWGMMVAESDLPHFEARCGGSTGWEGPGPHRHDALSPVSFVGRVKTPVLILHGERDERVLVSQGRFFARGLREGGVPHQLVVYPREPHGLRERNHQLDALRRTRTWFDRWLRPAQSSNSTGGSAGPEARGQLPERGGTGFAGEARGTTGGEGDQR